ncbi:MAG TPA: hypothetical protein ENI65_07915 [Gammaproteobacteria bacterium]|nr:hypothetical protein [Gammaproteobacteria bacterium]
MKIFSILKYGKTLLFISILVAPLLVNAANTGQKKEKTIHDYEFSLELVPDGSFKPVVREKGTGKLIKRVKIKKGTSLPATSVEEIQTLTILRIRGSHYIIIVIDGVTYKFFLPH